MKPDRTVFNCTIIDIFKINSESGNITGEVRGGHAHYELEQYIIAASGSFDVILDDGVNRKRVSLNRPNQALHVVPGLWRELDNFSSGSICLVLASQTYSEEDYIRNYCEFKDLKKL